MELSSRFRMFQTYLFVFVGPEKTFNDRLVKWSCLFPSWRFFPFPELLIRLRIYRSKLTALIPINDF